MLAFHRPSWDNYDNYLGVCKMPRRMILSICIFLSAVPRLSAGFAFFDPPEQVVLPGSSQLTMAISLASSALPHFDSATVLFVSDVPLTFEYSDDFKAMAASIVTPSSLQLGLGVEELLVGGTLTSPTPLIELGTLSIPTCCLAPGAYYVTISSAMDQGISRIAIGSQVEGVSGQGVFFVGVPELSTLPLLLQGSLVLFMKR